MCSSDLAQRLDLTLSEDAEAIRRSVRMDNIKRDIARLTALESRVSGFPGADSASKYVFDRFQEIGLEDVETHTFQVTAPIEHGLGHMVVRDAQGVEMVEMGEPGSGGLKAWGIEMDNPFEDSFSESLNYSRDAVDPQLGDEVGAEVPVKKVVPFNVENDPDADLTKGFYYEAGEDLPAPEMPVTELARIDEAPAIMDLGEAG